MQGDLTTKLLLTVVAALLALNLIKDLAAPANADRQEGPVGTYQISSYTLPPTDTRPNYIRGYHIVDTRTGRVEKVEESIW